jgi:hypothetical protein
MKRGLVLSLSCCSAVGSSWLPFVASALALYVKEVVASKHESDLSLSTCPQFLVTYIKPNHYQQYILHRLVLPFSFGELGYHIALGVDLVGFSRHSSVMVLLSLLSEVPAHRFFVVVVLTTCAYIVHKQSASKPVRNFPHETAVREVPAESPVFEAQEASHPSKPPDTPVSANYFPSQEFNYKCGFCFHTETSSYILTHDKAPKGLKLLKEAGMRKLNIASGELFLHPKFLSSLIRYCKENLGVEASVSSVTVARSPRSGCRRTPSGWISWLSPVTLLMLS